MKISQYNYFLKSKKHGYLVYNSMTNAFAKINSELFNLLSEAKDKVEFLNKLDNETLSELKKAKIITNENEINNHLYYRRLAYYASVYSNQALNLTIAPTSACNFSCPYCFEDNIKAKTMTNKTIENLIKFIKRYDNIKGLGLTWYGGEPLLATNKIEAILNKIRKLNIPILSNGMITNAYYLNEENQNFIIRNEISFLQITLDGADSESHNKKRFTKEGTGSWDTIISNIDSFLQKKHKTNISIRCNLDNNNSQDFFKLKNDFNEKWKNNSQISVYPGFLMDHDTDIKKACSFMSNEDITKFNYDLGVKEKSNIYFSFDALSCGARHINSYLVGPEGELYKCWNDLGRNNMIIGYLDNDKIPNIDVLAQYLAGPTSFDDEECKNCELFFVCTGGCPWQRIKNKFEGTSYNLCDYRKNNIDKFLELHYENKLAI